MKGSLKVRPSTLHGTSALRTCTLHVYRILRVVIIKFTRTAHFSNFYRRIHGYAHHVISVSFCISSSSFFLVRRRVRGFGKYVAPLQA